MGTKADVDPDLAQGFKALDPALVKLMTPEELGVYETAPKAYTALLSPLNFAVFTSSADRMAHIELLDLWLVALQEGRLYKDGPGPAPLWSKDRQRFEHPETGEPVTYFLAISMPPRHGKSYLTSHHLPAWLVCRWPNRFVAVASYEADFAASWGKKARDLVKEHGKDFGVQLDNDSQAGARWNLRKPYHGGMITAGAGGPFTGKGAHVIVIDDPIKNAEEALSEVRRANLVNWYTSTAFTRREPIKQVDQDGILRVTEGRIVLMNTRWHEDDLQGHLTTEEPEKWAVLNLPALSEGEGDPLDRPEGAALAPERYPKEVLESIQVTQGVYWFNAMYQGRPQVVGGGYIPRPFHYHRHVRLDSGLGHYEFTDRSGTLKRVAVQDCIRFGTLDLAASTKTRADWSVLGIWDETPDRELLLVRIFRERMETPDHETRVRAWLADLDKPVSFLGIEDKTYGTALIQAMVRNGGVIIRPLKADTDKIARAIPAGQAIMNWEVYFPKYAEWLGVWEHELEAFPGKDDDQVDVLGYAVQQHLLMPRRRPQAHREATTLQEKVNAHLDKLVKAKKGRHRHQVLGRF